MAKKAAGKKKPAGEPHGKTREACGRPTHKKPSKKR
jgi:hypothetical protein